MAKTNTASPAAAAAVTERNGFRRPQRGSTAAMWDLFDSATSEITPDHLKAVAEQKGWNSGLLRSHFRQWKGFNSGAPVKAKNGKAAVAAPSKAPAKPAPTSPAAAKKASKNAELAAALAAGPKNPPKVHLSEAVQDGARQAMLKAKGSKAKAEPVTA